MPMVVPGPWEPSAVVTVSRRPTADPPNTLRESEPPPAPPNTLTLVRGPLTEWPVWGLWVTEPAPRPDGPCPPPPPEPTLW
jgi:hypothetical protein